MVLTAILTYRKIQAKFIVRGVKSGSLRSCGKAAHGMDSPEGVLFLKGSAKMLAWKSFWCITEVVQIM